jgi:hypothetical protein
MISILEREKIDKEAYIRLIANCENTLIYTDLNYLDAISEYTKSELYFVVDVVDREIVSALPFCIYFGSYGPVINSLPFYGSNGGIISRNKKISNFNLIIDKILEFAKENRCVSVTIIESPLNPAFDYDFNRFNYRDSRISLLNYFDHNMKSSDLMESFEDPRPRNIRRAIKTGVEVKESHTIESIEFLAKTHYQNISSIGGIPKNYDFFQFITARLPTNQWVILDALYDGIRIASLLLLYSEDVIEYFTPVNLPEFRHLQAQSLLIFTGMRFAIANKIYIWNWGGTWNTQKGVYDFKKKWGPMELKYNYYCAILEESILYKSKTSLIEQYPYFYVLPFSELKV